MAKNLSDFDFIEYKWTKEGSIGGSAMGFVAKCANGNSIYICPFESDYAKDTGKLIDEFDKPSYTYNVWVRDKNDNSVSKDKLRDLAKAAGIASIALDSDHYDNFIAQLKHEDTVAIIVVSTAIPRATQKKSDSSLMSNTSSTSSTSSSQTPADSEYVDAPDEPCSICGIRDKFNSRVKKFGNQVRCYNHCC